MPVKTEDIECLSDVLSSGAFERPNLKISIYKNRRGRYKGIMLWCSANLGVCRVQPMFATTYDYELLSIEDVKIIVQEEDEKEN